MFNRLSAVSFLIVLLSFSKAYALELIIGEKRVEPGIVFIFEGAVKDQVMPTSMHLAEAETHIHIEARVNWDNKNIPRGTPAGGFVPYLHLIAQVTNQKTNLSSFIDLLPHINLVDNFHYARNMSLPGSIEDLYTVKFSLTKPTALELALHRDWLLQYGTNLLADQVFEYRDVNFKEIAEASRL